MMDNPSFVLNGINNVSFEDRPIPDLRPTDVLIRMEKTGICGTDVHYLTHGRIGEFVLKNPIVLGHEPAGVVCKLGSEVKDLKEGTRVALEPGVACFTCDLCESGRYEICPDMIFAANPPYDGTLGRYYKLPARLAYPLPDDVSMEEGAMMEPLAVAIHAVSNVGQLQPNQNVAVFGAGPVGLLCMAAAKACGASRVLAVDVVSSRLSFARQYAATDIYETPAREDNEPSLVFSKRVAATMASQFGIDRRGPSAIDLVIDASGAEVCIQTGLFLVRNGGTLVQVGMGSAEIQIPITHVLVKEINLKGSFRFGHGDYPTAIDLVAQGKINLKPLVTHRYAFKDAISAFQDTKAGSSPDGRRVIKAIISGPDVDVNSDRP